MFQTTITWPLTITWGTPAEAEYALLARVKFREMKSAGKTNGFVKKLASNVWIRHWNTLADAMEWEQFVITSTAAIDIVVEVAISEVPAATAPAAPVV